VAMQQAIFGHNRTAEAELAIRVGVAIGEVDEEDGDFFGEPVVEAARLCAKADGGQILVTELVRVLAGRRTVHEVVSVGALELKGLPEPVEAVEVRWSPPQVPVDADRVPLPSRLENRDGVFVGRDAERAVLVDALKSACDDGRVRVVLIGGEPGIGKSTLASMFAQGAHRDGSTVLYGRCDQDLGIPYQPWREALEDLLAHGPSEVSEVAVANEGLLASLGIGSGVAAPGSSDAATARYLGFGAVASVLAAAGEAAGLVVIVDDLHWADAQSLQLLRHLATAKQPMRLVVVGTFRESEVGAGTPLAGLLADLRRESTVVRVSLGGLGDLDVLALMESGAGRPLEPAELGLRDALLAETDGNPFFVWELLRHLVETGGFRQDASGRWEASAELDVSRLPVSVREVIGQRVAHLGPAATSVLSVAAVIGRDFETRVLAAAADIDEGDLVDLLDRAIAAGLVADVGSRRLSFSHALIEHALYTGLSSSRRALTHRRVAEALEGLHADDPGRAAELAHHWAKATTPQDATKAVAFAQKAADHASARLAPDDARRWYAEALALLDQQRSPDELLRCELSVGLGEAQRQCGDAAFRETLLAAARQAMRLGEARLLVRAAMANSRGVYANSGNVDLERVEVLRAACNATEGDRSAERTRLLALLASELTWDADGTESRLIADEALVSARELGDAATLMTVLNLRFITLTAPDRLADSLAETAEALALAGQVNDPLQEWFAAFWRYWATIQAADHQAAEHAWAIMSERAVTLGEGVVQGWMPYQAAVRAIMGGDLTEAERLADQALHLSTETGQADAAMAYGVLLGCIRREQDRAAEIVPLLEQQVEALPTLPGLRVGLARWYCDLDRPVAARRLLDPHVAAGFADLRWDTTWLLGALYAGDAIAELGWVEAAQVLLPRLRPFTQEWVFIGTGFGPVARTAARLAALAGLFDEADHYFASPKRLASRWGPPCSWPTPTSTGAGHLPPHSGQQTGTEHAAISTTPWSWRPPRGWLSLNAKPARRSLILSADDR